MRTEGIQISTFELMIEHFWAITQSIEIVDILDIVIVAFLIYKLIGLVRETRAAQLINGVLAMLLLFITAEIFQFRMVETILKFILTYGVVVLLVLFQPELRKILEQIGKTSISSLHFFQNNHEESAESILAISKGITEIVESCEALAKTKTGALIVIECQIKIGDIISTGTLIDAHATRELIQNVFFHNAPLHDGAMVIREGRIYSAGCFLPLSQNYEISNMLGTRHRAALGMSEVSDAIIIIVSEETGAISVARNGKLNQRLSGVGLSKMLNNLLLPQPKELTKKRRTKKIFTGGEK